VRVPGPPLLCSTTTIRESGTTVPEGTHENGPTTKVWVSLP
jgi:hypothetical protein